MRARAEMCRGVSGRVQVCYATCRANAPRWSPMDVTFTIDAWTDEIRISLVDASAAAKRKSLGSMTLPYLTLPDLT